MDEETREILKAEAGNTGFWSRHGSRIVTTVLALYLVLLLIGTIAEVFDIEPVLDWWLWHTPGKPSGA